MYCNSKQKGLNSISQVTIACCIGIIISFTLTGCNVGLSSNTTSSSSAQIMGIPGKPKVSSINPADNAIYVSLDTSITVTYDYPVKSVNTTTFTVTKQSSNSNIDGEITAKGDNLTFTFTPAQPLVKNTEYKVNLKGVKNYEDIEGGNAEDFSSSFSTEKDNLIIFITTGQYNGGSIGTSDAADTLCANEAKDGGLDLGTHKSGTYKAMLGYSNRQVNSSGWVLQANQDYVSNIKNNAGEYSYIVRTTGNATFPDNLAGPILPAINRIWTGIKKDWAYNPNYNCKEWSSGDEIQNYGRIGSTSKNGGVVTADILDVGTLYCKMEGNPEYDPINNYAHLYCVEQPHQ